MSSSLSALSYQSVSSTITQSSLWQQLVQKIPGIRNATQYYAYDVQKFSMGVYDSVVSAKDEQQLVLDKEVHYQPSPLQQCGIQVKALSIDVLNMELDGYQGRVLLSLCIDRGLAVFEVTESGVFEIFVDLNVHVGTPIAVKSISRSTIIFLTADSLCKVDVKTKKFGAPVKLKAEFQDLYLMKDFIVATASEFSQVVLFSKATLNEVRAICADNTVLAVSSQWLAYSGMGDETQTNFTAKKTQTTMESVTKNVISGIQALKQGLWGETPGMHASQVPLGSIVIHDASTGEDIACFSAHNHPVQCMKWDPTGMLLGTASTAGTTVNVFQIIPSGGGRATVTLLYRLIRGLTQCTISDIDFGPLYSWVAVCSSVGTCHFYSIPSEQRQCLGKAALNREAPSITASCRARSAPSSTPVNPQVRFSPFVNRDGQNTISTNVMVTSTTGMVSFARVAEEGAQLLYVKYIDAFQGPLERGNSPLCNMVVDEKDESAWRSHIELVSHPEYPPLTHFVIPGIDSAESKAMTALNPVLPVHSAEDLERQAVSEKVSATLQRKLEGDGHQPKNSVTAKTQIPKPIAWGKQKQVKTAPTEQPPSNPAEPKPVEPKGPDIDWDYFDE